MEEGQQQEGDQQEGAEDSVEERQGLYEKVIRKTVFCIFIKKY